MKFEIKIQASGPNDIVLENIVPQTTGMNDTLKFTVGPYILNFINDRLLFKYLTIAILGHSLNIFSHISVHLQDGLNNVIYSCYP